MTPKQAVKNLKEIIELSRNEINKKNENLTAVLDLTDLESLDIVLFMLENQKERIDYLMRSIERKEQSLIEEHEENIECYTKIEEKDKIIDLMANHIATTDSNLCEYLDMTTKCKYSVEKKQKNCDECVKQYFENKAKEEE